MTVYYAVRNGRQTGIFNDWESCADSVLGYPYNEFRKFSDRRDAEDYLNEESDGSGGDDPYEFDVYTDGSCRNNQNQRRSYAGIGVWCEDNDFEDISRALDGPVQTNQRAELAAISAALDQILRYRYTDTRYDIKTDSQYALNCLFSWYDGWVANGWYTTTGNAVKNRDLIEECHGLLEDVNDFYDSCGWEEISMTHVRGHNGEVGNENADGLARDGAAWCEKRMNGW